MIYGTCGHQIENIEKAECVWEEYSNGELGLAYGCLCDECQKLYPIVKNVEKWEKKHWGQPSTA